MQASYDTLTLQLSYEWDEAGHLAKATRNESVWTSTQPSTEVSASQGIEDTYVYDAAGQRVVHSSNNNIDGADVFTIDVFPSLRLVGSQWNNLEPNDYDRTDTTEAIYLTCGGASYGRAVYDVAGDLPSLGNPLHVFLELGDALGSSSSVIDRDTSELVEQTTYLPFGQVDSDYRATRWNSFRESFQYSGKEGDYEVGLVYYGARYYSPLLFRWASPDPLAIHALGADLNPYRFVWGNPLRFVDPLGLSDSDTQGQDPPPPPPPSSPAGIDPTTITPYANGVLGAVCNGPACKTSYEFWNGPVVAPQIDGSTPASPSFDPAGDGGFVQRTGLGAFSAGPRTDGSGFDPTDSSKNPWAARQLADRDVRVLEFGTGLFGSTPNQVRDILRTVVYGAMVVSFLDTGGLSGEVLTAAEGVNAPRLAMDLARQEAESAFTATGELSQEAVQGARQIMPPGRLGNPAIPQGFGKFSTQTFQSPSGPFQVHFYMNPSTGKTFYGLDFKAIVNGEQGPTYFQPFSGSAP